MPLHTNIRPDNIDGFITIPETKAQIEKWIKDKQRNHTVLITGKPGTGKTTLARILSKTVGVLNTDLDYFEYNASSKDYRGVGGVIQNILETAYTMPIKAPSKVYVIDECHGLTKDAWSAALKVMEEPPPYVYFLFCTSNPEQIKNSEAVFRRMYKLILPQLDSETVSTFLKNIPDITASKKIRKQISISCNGCIGVALEMLDSVLNMDTEESIQLLKRQNIDESEVIDLCRALVKESDWNTIIHILNGLRDKDAESIRWAMLGYATSVMLNSNSKPNTPAFKILYYAQDNTFDTGFNGIVRMCYEIYNN